jgi:hypothetical protein
MSQAAPPPSEEEAKAFADKLRAFHDSLPGNEHLLLDALVVAASGEQPTGAGEEAAAGAPPNEREVEGFWQKLQGFHDALPGQQHRFVDALVARATGEAEVEGYHGTVLFSWSSTVQPGTDLVKQIQCAILLGHVVMHVPSPPTSYTYRCHGPW